MNDLEEFEGRIERITALFRRLNHELEHFRSCSPFVTKRDLTEAKESIMSAISEFAARQNAFNDRQDAAITGLQQDVLTLNETIEKLQNTSGAITPEDQALLNAIEQRGDAIAAKLEALDALTPPPAPVEPPVEPPVNP